MESSSILREITNYLQKKETSASTIAKELGYNRVTITKYLEILKAQEIINYKESANAKVWYLTENKKPRILIVDDEKHVAKLIKLSLQKGRYAMNEVYSGKEALESIEEQQPNLIILDLMMPKISGYDVLKKVKENEQTKDIPIIILSAKGQLPDKVKSYQSGALFHITKPFDPLELEVRVRVLLEKEKNDGVHPITGLPGKKTCERFIREAVFSKTHQFYHALNIVQSKEIAKKYGYKKMHDLIKIFGRMLEESHTKETFIGHDEETETFIIATNTPQLEKNITKLFHNVTSYVFANAEKEKEAFSIQCISLSLLEVENKKIYIDDMLTYLRV